MTLILRECVHPMICGCLPVCRYVTGVFLKQEEMHSRLQSQFVTQQLFSMFEVLDFSDEVGRYGK